MVERAEFVSGDEDDRQFQIGSEIGDPVICSKRDFPTARAFDEDLRVFRGEVMESGDQFRRIHGAVFQHPSDIRGDRGVEINRVDFIEIDPAGYSGQDNGVLAIPAGDGFVTDGVPALVPQGFDDQAGDVGFADVGVRSRDEKAHGGGVACAGGGVKARE